MPSLVRITVDRARGTPVVKVIQYVTIGPWRLELRQVEARSPEQLEPLKRMFSARRRTK